MNDLTDNKAGIREKEQTVVMVCLSPSPSSKRVIRAAAGLMRAENGGRGTALYVSSSKGEISADSQIYENIRYARSCGFEVNTAQSNDIALTISEYAKISGVTDLFLGYTAQPHILNTGKPISEELVQYLPEIYIHIIPDAMASSYPLERGRDGSIWSLRDFLTVLLVMAMATLLAFLIYHSRYSNANIITIYILGVLISSLVTSHQIYGIMAAVLYVLLFNFLFIDPRYTLLVYDSEYLVTYLVSVAAGLITGSLTSRMTDIARMSAANAYQAKVLLDTSNQLEKASGPEEIIQITCRQLVHLLKRPVYYLEVYQRGDTYDYEPVYTAGVEQGSAGRSVLEQEKDAVMWTILHRHHSGAFTTRFDSCRYRYVSINTDKKLYGVIGIDMKGENFTEFENTILLAILNEFTLALDNRKMIEEWQAAEISAQNERLRSGLLRSISHDLRTPLTAIYGNASTLVSNEQALSAEDKAKIYSDMMEDAGWLTMQMENILSMTKLENHQYLNLNVENLTDVIEESLKHLQPHPEHTIEVIPSEDTYLTMIDSRLIMQVMVNLLNNAVKYTPPGTPVRVRTDKEDGWISVYVEDEGEGISEEDKEHIFELFYTGKRSLEDSYRSMGLGLNLCRMILLEHGGDIQVYDNEPKGTVFRFRLREINTDE